MGILGRDFRGFTAERDNYFLRKFQEAGDAKDAAEDLIEGYRDLSDPEQFRSQPDTSLSVFFGTRGKGKTASMVYMADFAKRRSEKLMRRKHPNFERRVFANIQVDFAHRAHATIYHDLQKFDEIKAALGTGGEMDFIGGILLMDEIADVAPAMRTMSGDSMGLSNALRMLRKLKLEMFACAQFPQELGRVVLRQVDFFIQPEIIHRRRVFDQKTGKMRKTADVKTFWFNWNGTFTGRPLFGTHWPPRPEIADRTIVFPDLGRVWNKYSTDEIVLSPHTLEGKRQLQSHKEKMERESELSELEDTLGQIPLSEMAEYCDMQFGYDDIKQVQNFAAKAGYTYHAYRGVTYFEKATPHGE